jgi:hypothetical protein
MLVASDPTPAGVSYPDRKCIVAAVSQDLQRKLLYAAITLLCFQQDSYKSFKQFKQKRVDFAKQCIQVDSEKERYL